MLLTVVIPTYNRPDQLQALLASLEAQTLCGSSLRGSEFEVIVVDDGSTQDYTEVIKRSWPFTLRTISQENAGEAVARNHGVSAARASFIVFLDDDMVVVPEYLEKLYTEHQAYPTALLLGHMVVPEESQGTVFQRLSAQNPYPVTFGFVPFTAMAAGVLALDRRLYEALGGMKPFSDRKRGGWMDLAFAYRGYEAGYKFRRCAGAIAFHHDYTLRSRPAYSKRMVQISRFAPSLFALLPGLKPHVAMFRHLEPIDWQRDKPRLITRKLAWQFLSSRPILWFMETLCDVLEVRKPTSRLLLPLYRLIKEVYKFRGYRQGLKERHEAR